MNHPRIYRTITGNPLAVIDCRHYRQDYVRQKIESDRQFSDKVCGELEEGIRRHDAQLRALGIRI